MATDWVFGIHAVQSVVESKGKSVLALYVQKGRKDRKIQEIVDIATSTGVVVRSKSKQELDRLAHGNHQGVVAELSLADEGDEGDLEQVLSEVKATGDSPFLLILDGVTDPHNLGACIRTANGAGVHAVIYPKDKSAKVNATVRKVACGAAEFTPLIAVTNLARTMKWLQQNGMWLVGAAGEAEDLQHELDFSGALAIVMGSEGKGLRRLTRENCDQLAKIPMCGQVESLNVSVATGVFLYEAKRQRLQSEKL